MATLGDLIINIKVTGDREALAAIARINQQAQQSSTAFRAGAASASGYFNTLNNGAFNATRAFMNMSGEVKVGNDNLSQLIQNLSAVKILFGNLAKFKFPSITMPRMKFRESKEFYDAIFSKFYPEASAAGREMPIRAFEKNDFGNFKNAVRLIQDVLRTIKDPLLQQDDEIVELGKRLQGFRSQFGKIFGEATQKAFKSFEFRQSTINNLTAPFKLAGNFFIDLFSKFSNKFPKVIGLFGKLGNVIGQVGNFLGPAAGAMIKFVQLHFEYYKILWSFAIPAFTALAMGASQAAASMERMKSQLAAINMGAIPGLSAAGGKNLAGDMLVALKKVSADSIYTLQQLFEATSRLSAFGINAFKDVYNNGEPVIQIMSKLAQVFGGMPDDLEMVVRMFGRMASGDLPDIEVLSRFGLSKQKLNEVSNRMFNQDLVDRNTGKLAGTAEQGVRVLLEVIQEKYAGLFKVQAKNFDVKMATLQETFGTVLEKIGKPINDALIPIIESLTNFAQKLIDSGTASRIGEAMAEIIGLFDKPEVMKSFENMIINITAVVIEATREFAKFTIVIMGIADMLSGVGKIMAGDFKAGKEDIQRGWKLFKDPMQTGGTQPGIQPFMMQMLNNTYRALDLNNMMKQKEFQKDPAKLNEKLQQQPLLKPVEQMNSNLDTIASNTGRAADALELRKANLGGRGGALAQIGMGVNSGSDPVGITRAALPPSFALLNPVNQLQKSIQMEVFRTTNANYLRRY